MQPSERVNPVSHLHLKIATLKRTAFLRNTLLDAIALSTAGYKQLVKGGLAKN